MPSITRADEGVVWREASRAFDEAPQAPIAGTSTVAVFNEKLQAVSFFLGDTIASHAMDVFPKYSTLIPVRTKNPHL